MGHEALGSGIGDDAGQQADYAESFGLNDLVHVRFWRYLTGILHGDLGVSLSQNRPVADILAEVFPNTCKLALSTSLLTARSVQFGHIHYGYVLGFLLLSTQMDKAG